MHKIAWSGRTQRKLPWQIVEGDDCSIVTDQSLLDETARLVEWPVVLRGQINSEFSVLPQKVLQVSMRQCQKFFSVLNTGTGQIESFLAIANVAAEKNGQKILLWQSLVALEFAEQ
jgi:glycyl-tRNA synthetase beta subunit